MRSSDPEKLLAVLRTKLSRDLGGMSNLRLYKHSWFGTKQLIHEYIDTATAAVERFLELAAESSLSTASASRYQMSLEAALKFFGRSALTLSGGALLGMKHIGVVKALWEADLLPQIISGTSAGSIVAAVVATSTDEEMMAILEHFPYSDLAVFDPLGTGSLGWLTQRVRTLVNKFVLFDINNLQRVMKTWLGDVTFLEAHNKTGRVLNIAVSAADSSQAQVLNYITAPHVYVRSAVCASCSVPFVFQPATIYEKDPRTKKETVWMRNSQQLFVDGSLDQDIPMRRLSEMLNVNFFIVSQVNPHVRLFLDSEEVFTGIQPDFRAPEVSVIRKSIGFLKSEIVHRAQQAADFGAPRLLYRGASVLNQQYTGDINILPDIELEEYFSMLANPTPTFLQKATILGERATWPKLCRIRNCVAIELALLRAILELRDLANFNPEARASRRAANVAIRGRSGSTARFARGRSLSNHSLWGADSLVRAKASGPPSPLPLNSIRRNASSGSLIERLGLTIKDRLKMLSPKAGLDGESMNPFEESLVMTSPSADSGPQ